MVKASCSASRTVIRQMIRQLVAMLMMMTMKAAAAPIALDALLHEATLWLLLAISWTNQLTDKL